MELAKLVCRFEKGQIYVRALIHEMLGGQEQGGIATPLRVPVILLFSNKEGAEHGYEDGWRADGFYHYTGEGQKGDQQMWRGNLAIRDHRRTNKALMLFEGVGAGAYRFGGFMSCVDYYEQDADALGNPRRVYVFRLRSVDALSEYRKARRISASLTFQELVAGLHCPFCNPTGIVAGNDLAYAIYDRFPASPGHMLIIPKRHVPDFFDTSSEEKRAISVLLDKSKARLHEELEPDGYNIGVNCGRAAGQTIFHAHVHLIPRYKGDVSDPRGGVRGAIPSKRLY